MKCSRTGSKLLFHNGVYHLKKNIVFIDVTLNTMFFKKG